MSRESELAHLFRAMKMPAAARAMPNLAERARQEEWSYERLVEALLSTEISSRESSGGRSRIRAARFPAHKTLEEFDFTFQRSVKKQVIEHLGQLDFLHAKQNVILLGPPGTGKTHISIALGIRACLAGQRVLFRTATEWVALLGDAQRQGRLDARARPARADPAADLRRGRLHPVRPPSREPHVHARLPPLRTRQPDRHLATSRSRAWGEIFGDDVAAVAMVDRLVHHAELISPQRRQLPPQRPRPRTPPHPPRRHHLTVPNGRVAGISLRSPQCQCSRGRCVGVRPGRLALGWRWADPSARCRP